MVKDLWRGATGRRARRTGAALLIAAAVFPAHSASALFLGSSGAADAHLVRGHKPTGTAPFRDGSVLMAFRAGVTAAQRQAALTDVGAHRLRSLGAGADLLRVAGGHVWSVVDALRSDPAVRYAEPDFESELAAVPNDPSFSLQWAFQNTGQTVNGIKGNPGSDENATAAWNVATGSRSVVIGEVDTGVDYTHPDLAANIWTNPGTVNGCAAGTHGYNVLTGTCDPMDDDTQYGGHGTHVAGIMGAVGNNGTGVTGVNWTTTILPVKWVSSSGSGTTSDLITGLDWLVKAKQAGVNIRVVNDSDVFYGTAYSQALSDEITLLGQNGILFVTAAGNTSDNNDNPGVRRYPCGYDLSNEICVSATTQTDQLASWSNYGATTVDLAAPGDNIYSTLRGGTYGYISGTSMASAQVAGTAALILSRQDMTPANVKARILETVDPLSSLNGMVRTGGRLDVCKAVPGCATVTAPTVPFSVTPPAVTASGIGPGPEAGSALSAGTGSWDPAPASLSYQWRRCSSTATSCSNLTGATSSSYTPGSADVGYTLQVLVTATDSAGSTTAASPPTMVVQSAPSGLTFGKTTVGASSDLSTADWERVDSFGLGQSGSVSKLTIYLARAASGSQLIRGVLYADSAGTPGALLAAANPITFGSSATSGWYDMPFSAPVPLQAGTYWIGLQAGATTNVTALRYDTAAAGSGAVAPATFANGPLSPFGPATIQTEQISIYATYTASSSTTTTTTTTTTSTTSTTSTSTTTSSTTTTSTPTTTTSTSTTTSTTTTSPPTTTATLGTTTVGSKSDTMAADRKRVNKVQLGGSANLTKLSIYLQPTSTAGSQSIEGVVYADSGGAPAALKAVSNAITFSSTESAGWYDLVFPSSVALPAGTYWIGFMSSGKAGVTGFRWNSVSGSRDYNVNTYNSGPSNPFGRPTVDSEQMSLYATYTTG